MNRKVIYLVAAVLSLGIYSCSVDPLEKDTKSLNASESFKGSDSLKVRSFNQEMSEAADNIEKAVDKGKK
ncbi:hypothetical protein HX071_12360 [Myroides marinus]|uniref:hypothetical protein n=1 Tax=Myroides marinus TaxID=703342 RepID=UPI002574E512|nr:hypothetical protein [Myroides marinus]MDM1405837.1 hypothetical protein [Myroides marinus]MDM1502984.1 hypothetical protein [Myroides marinus]